MHFEIAHAISAVRHFGGRSGMIRGGGGGLSKLVALLPNSMQIVHNWSEKGVDTIPLLSFQT